MAKYLLKSTDTYRLETLDAVEAFHQELLDDGTFDLTGFNYVVKPIKEKKEVVGEYYVVKATKQFTDEKEPAFETTIEYNTRDNYEGAF